MFAAALAISMLVLQPDAPRPPARYTLIKLSGDIDSQRLLAQVSDELDKAREAGLVIIEVDGNRARPDLIARLGARLKASTVPVGVFLKDAVDRKVGLGQAMLGSFAAYCAIDPATTIEWMPEDDLRWQAPDDISWEAVSRELSGSLWTRLKDREADTALSQVLTDPGGDWWAVPATKGPWRLSNAEPASGQSGPDPRHIVRAGTLVPTRITIDSDAMIGLRLCEEKSQSVAPLLKRAGLPPAPARTLRPIASGLTNAAASIAQATDDAKLNLKKCLGVLKVKTTGPRQVTNEDYRQAGKSAVDLLERAQRQLDRGEQLIAEYPELERRKNNPPRKGARGPWRTELDDLARDLDKLRTTAREYMSR